MDTLKIDQLMSDVNQCPLLRDEIANTVSNTAQVDEEMLALFSAFGT